VEAFEDRVDWRLTASVEVLGLARDAESVPLIARLLDKLPSEGEFETALKFDSLIAALALALRRIGEPAGAVPLLRFAASRSPRMREARQASALAVAMLAPARGDAVLLERTLELVVQINSSEENTAALFAYGLIGRVQPEATRRELLERLRAAKPMASSYVEVQLAKAVARRLLGEEGDAGAAELEVAELMTRALTEPAWKEEYTVRRRRWAVAMFEVLPAVDAALLAPLLALHDEELTAALSPLLARHGVEVAPPRRISWFEALAQSDDALAALLRDEAVAGRYHAARALGMRMSERVRQVLEEVVARVAAQAPSEASRDLPSQEDRLLTEAVTPLLRAELTPSTLELLNRLLRHGNRQVKWRVLKEPPADPALAEGMRHVVAEGWGWQESTAREWLERHGEKPS
jgi:hypothetical protein